MLRNTQVFLKTKESIDFYNKNKELMIMSKLKPSYKLFIILFIVSSSFLLYIFQHL